MDEISGGYFSLWDSSFVCVLANGLNVMVVGICEAPKEGEREENSVCELFSSVKGRRRRRLLRGESLTRPAQRTFRKQEPFLPDAQLDRLEVLLRGRFHETKYTKSPQPVTTTSSCLKHRRSPSTASLLPRLPSSLALLHIPFPSIRPDFSVERLPPAKHLIIPSAVAASSIQADSPAIVGSLSSEFLSTVNSREGAVHCCVGGPSSISSKSNGMAVRSSMLFIPLDEMLIIGDHIM